MILIKRFYFVQAGQSTQTLTGKAFLFELQKDRCCKLLPLTVPLGPLTKG
jgi:hypothetical protein